MTGQYIATFRNVKGRYLVEREGPYAYGGQRIIPRGGFLDGSTGLHVNESYRTFDASEIVTLKPAPVAAR